MTTEPSPDAVCRCGHPESEHDELHTPRVCLHENDTDKTTGHLFCECNSFLPASPSAAHDTLAAQLRERLARAERENDRLREQVAALQPSADGYAGALAELTEWRKHAGFLYAHGMLQAYLQPAAPRPDAQEETR